MILPGTAEDRNYFKQIIRHKHKYSS
jgi:hypothetical protein